LHRRSASAANPLIGGRKATLLLLLEQAAKTPLAEARAV
jgi:hypothetical protein